MKARGEKLKVGDDVRCYGFGSMSAFDYHDGCRGRINSFSLVKGCTTGANDAPVVGIKFTDNTFDWFAPQQLAKYKGKK